MTSKGAPYAFSILQAMLLKPHIGASGSPCRIRRLFCVLRSRKPQHKMVQCYGNETWYLAAFKPLQTSNLQAHLHIQEDLVLGDVVLYLCVHAGTRFSMVLRPKVIMDLVLSWRLCAEWASR